MEGLFLLSGYFGAVKWYSVETTNNTGTINLNDLVERYAYTLSEDTFPHEALWSA